MVKTIIAGAVDEVAFWNEAISVEDSMEPLPVETQGQINNRLGRDKKHVSKTMETNSEKFAEQGYLVVKSALLEADLAPLIAIISDVVDKRATELYNERVISNTYKDMSFEHRWHAILKACERENEVFGWHTLVFSEALFNLITHPKVLGRVRIFLSGADIQFNGDFWVRPKTPERKTDDTPLAPRQCVYATHRKRYTSYRVAPISRCQN